MQAFVRLPTEFDHLLLNAAGYLDVSPNENTFSLKECLHDHQTGPILNLIFIKKSYISFALGFIANAK